MFCTRRKNKVTQEIEDGIYSNLRTCGNFPADIKTKQNKTALIELMGLTKCRKLVRVSRQCGTMSKVVNV